MAEKEAFITGFMTKFAGWKDTLMRPVNWYKATNASPVFKAKKNLARATIIAGGAGYGMHKLTEAPEPQRVAAVSPQGV